MNYINKNILSQVEKRTNAQNIGKLILSEHEKELKDVEKLHLRIINPKDSISLNVSVKKETLPDYLGTMLSRNDGYVETNIKNIEVGYYTNTSSEFKSLQNIEIIQNSQEMDKSEEIKDQVVDEATKEASKTENTSTTSETTNTAVTASEVINKADLVKDDEDDCVLTHIDEDFAYEFMSIPTHSASEYRMVTFITLWALKNNIDFEFDEKGNLYLTKGELKEGEYYPCVTSHLDTVQTKQKAYAQCNVNMEIDTTIVAATQKHKMSVKGIGIGADCKSGLLICLSLFKHVDVLKACFFLEEETGMLGSKRLNVDWFKNVGYVIGFDSPDLNRAAYSTSGTKLFDQKFFKEYIMDVCKQHGVNDFRAEPFTDVAQIREKTDLICMNFGNGGYDAHSSVETCVLEDMDASCRMGHALIEKIGKTQHKLPCVKSTYSSHYSGDSDYDFYAYEVKGKEKPSSTPTTRRYGSNYGGDYYDDDDYGRYPNYGGYGSHSSAQKSTSTVAKPQENTIDYETLAYITDKYEAFISNIKKKTEDKCKELNIDFEKEFAEYFKTDVTF